MIHINRDWGVFIGQFNDNKMHKHYALQISIALDENFSIIDITQKEQLYSSCFIQSNIQHTFICAKKSIIILINPISILGHALSLEFEYPINILPLDLEESIKKNGLLYEHKMLSFEQFIINLTEILFQIKCQCFNHQHVQDDRIYQALQYLENNTERVVPLAEISKVICLSESRFLHLFKEKTQLNYRAYQLWNKLVKSFIFLQKQSISTTAHQLGFTDSAHYSRSFKEMFGLSPKVLQKEK